MSESQYDSLYHNKSKEKADQEKQTHDQAQKRARPSAPVVYTAILHDGEDELTRPAASLWWSGIAAGLAIFFSVIATGALTSYQEEMQAPNLFSHLGYTIGFLIVILGRLQLFTENTITAVIPMLSKYHHCTLRAVLRVWGIVFAANMIGVFVSACASYYGNIFPEKVLDGMLSISAHYMHRSAWDFFTQGVPAGFLVAAIVWMLPSARSFEFWVIVAITYMISALGLTHVVAGSGEAFLMLLDGQATAQAVVFKSILPTLAGNVLGGTLLFTMLAYGQVHKEI